MKQFFYLEFNIQIQLDIFKHGQRNMLKMNMKIQMMMNMKMMMMNLKVNKKYFKEEVVKKKNKNKILNMNMQKKIYKLIG